MFTEWLSGSRYLVKVLVNQIINTSGKNGIWNSQLEFSIISLKYFNFAAYDDMDLFNFDTSEPQGIYIDIYINKQTAYTKGNLAAYNTVGTKSASRLAARATRRQHWRAVFGDTAPLSYSGWSQGCHCTNIILTKSSSDD